jgi:hypothetical protein
MKRFSGYRAGGDASLGHGDQALDERPKLLGLWHGRLDPFMPQKGHGLVAEQRHTMFGDAPQFPVCNVVSHDELYRL